jgi:hypothetical protein
MAGFLQISVQGLARFASLGVQYSYFPFQAAKNPKEPIKRAEETKTQVKRARINFKRKMWNRAPLGVLRRVFCGATTLIV